MVSTKTTWSECPQEGLSKSHCAKRHQRVFFKLLDRGLKTTSKAWKAWTSLKHPNERPQQLLLEVLSKRSNSGTCWHLESLILDAHCSCGSNSQKLTLDLCEHACNLLLKVSFKACQVFTHFLLMKANWANLKTLTLKAQFGLAADTFESCYCFSKCLIKCKLINSLEALVAEKLVTVFSFCHCQSP